MSLLPSQQTLIRFRQTMTLKTSIDMFADYEEASAV